jgi:hypothetical protein
LWGLPYEVVETVANHDAHERIRRQGFDVSSAVTMAHALLEQVRPGDIPSFERNTSMLDDDYLRTVGYPHTWDSLLERTHALLNAEEAA